MNVRIMLEDIERHAPDVLLPPDPEFAEDYAQAVAFGRECAARSRIAFVFLARNSMPWLPRTLDLIEETGAMFKLWSAFAMENDSEDATKDVLAAWADGQQRQASLNSYKRPHLSHTMTQERTVALAEYRNACRQWVQDGEPVDLVCVLDSDSWGGWSVDGVATSVAHITREDWWGLASYSWCEMNTAIGPFAAGYDAWACRWTWWNQRSHDWFHHLHLPVGSRPVEMNSAFGQLAVYRADAYLRGRYSGETCEHVPYHKSIAEHPETRGRFGLNPSSRVTSFWVPTNGGQHDSD
jgi:hypothetical protein